MAAGLSGYTKTCVISFIDLYSKVARNFPEVRKVPKNERIEMGKVMIHIANKYGMTVKPCAEGNELAAYGADCSGCMTVETYEKAIHCRLNAQKKSGARRECACYLTSDIGSYNTCGHLCRYCYANYSEQLVKQNRKMHDVNSPFLIGGSRPDDVVHQAKQESWKNEQLSLFDFW